MTFFIGLNTMFHLHDTPVVNLEGGSDTLLFSHEKHRLQDIPEQLLLINNFFSPTKFP